MGKTAWPVNLAIFYPHPNTRYGLLTTLDGYPASEQWPLRLVLAAALLLITISFLVLFRARRQPFLVTGWFWYVGTVVPVIGLVQIGMQGMADRYTYIPLIGLSIGIVWGAVELLHSRRFGNIVLSASGLLLVICCAVATQKHAAYWRSNLTVFEHALKSIQHNAVAHSNVGEELALQGKLELAQEHFRAALKADPRYPLAYLDFGISFELQKKPELALGPYQAVIRLRPWSESARLRLANVFKLLGRHDEALAQYAEVLKLNPAQPLAYYELGTILAAQNKAAEAVAYLRQAVRLKPDYLEALTELAGLLAAQGKFAEAQAPFRAAAVLCPTNAALHLELGKALRLGGESAEAAAEFAEVVRLAPEFADKLLQEGGQLSSRGQFNAALVRFNTALWLTPDSPAALDGVAWLLATHPVRQFRNGPRALLLAQRALDLSGGKDARASAAVDADYAETGRFPEAIAAAEKTRELARSAGDEQAVQASESRLALYRNQQPYHQ